MEACIVGDVFNDSIVLALLDVLRFQHRLLDLRFTSYTMLVIQLLHFCVTMTVRTRTFFGILRSLDSACTLAKKHLSVYSTCTLSFLWFQWYLVGMQCLHNPSPKLRG